MCVRRSYYLIYVLWTKKTLKAVGHFRSSFENYSDFNYSHLNRYMLLMIYFSYDLQVKYTRFIAISCLLFLTSI